MLRAWEQVYTSIQISKPPLIIIVIWGHFSNNDYQNVWGTVDCYTNINRRYIQDTWERRKIKQKKNSDAILALSIVKTFREFTPLRSQAIRCYYTDRYVRLMVMVDNESRTSWIPDENAWATWPLAS
jgi:hypothetical protein